MTTRRSPPALALALLVSCASPDSQGVAYVDATVWDGTGSAPVPGVTIVVDGGRITAISTSSTPSGTQVVNLDGKFVIAGLIDVHAHVSGRWAPEGVTGEADRIRGDLELFAKYGVTTVNSLGDGEAGRGGFEVVVVRQGLIDETVEPRWTEIAPPMVGDGARRGGDGPCVRRRQVECGVFHGGGRGAGEC